MKNYKIINRLNRIASIIIFFATMTIFTSCEKEINIVVDGMAPIYFSYDDFTIIKTQPPRPYNQLGKIVTVGNYIYINEIKQGIHVIDNTDPNAPKKLYFWFIPGNTEFTIKDNILIADNSLHLMFIDISNPAAISTISAIKDQYPLIIANTTEREAFPPNYSGQFECYRPEKGNLSGWELKTLTNPLCRTN